jgi:hypothetical protein
MKRQFFKFQAAALAAMAAAVMFACTPVENPAGDKEIELTGGQKEQTVYADDTEGASAITFTAGADWTADVADKASSPSRANGTSWLKLLLDGEEKYSGGAGVFTLAIGIVPNDTGTARTAIITITCGETTITVTVTQEAKTKEGDDPNPSGQFDRTITGRITNLEDDDVTIVKASPFADVATLAVGTIVADVFSITLPETVESSKLSPFDLEGGGKVSDENVRQIHCDLVACKSDGTPHGDYLACLIGGNDVQINYMYVDRDCRITGGEHGDAVMYDADLKQGWNAVYLTDVGDDWVLTTTKPAGEMNWAISNPPPPSSEKQTVK